MWATLCFSQLWGLAMQEHGSHMLVGCTGTCPTRVPGLSMVDLVTLPCDIFGTLQLPRVWLCPFPDVHFTSYYSVLLFPPPYFFALFAFLKKSMNHHLEVCLSLLWLA